MNIQLVGQIEQLDKVLNFIQDEHNKSDSTTILLGGDFNVPWIDWETGIIGPNCSNKAMCEKLLECLSEHHLQQLQHKSTRLDSVLDLFCSNKPALVKDITVIPGVSDHDMVVIDTELKMHLNKKKPRNIKLWSKADWTRIKKDMTDYQETFMTKAAERSVDENYLDFTKFVNKMINSYVPEKRASSRRNAPWITPELRKLCRKKQRLYNKARRSHKPGDWEVLKNIPDA